VKHRRVGSFQIKGMSRQRSVPLVSISQVQRAIDEKLLNPESVVLLKTCISCVERDFRVLGPLRVKFEPLIDDIGNIVVTLVKSEVHNRATGFAYILAKELDAHDLGKGIRIRTSGEGNIQAEGIRREPDAEIYIYDSNAHQSTDSLVVQIFYSYPQDPDELRELLNWYVFADTGVRSSWNS
jgi:hypothetical protein